VGRLPSFHGLLAATLFAGCAPTTTTLRFTGDQHAVMVQNPEKAKVGSKLEALIGTRKKVFFTVTRGASVVSFRPPIDLAAGEKKLIAELQIDQHPVRFSMMQLRRPLAKPSPPTMQNKDAICRSPGIAEMVSRASTSIVGRGRGSWICAASLNRRLYFRPIDYDLVAIVDADELDPKRAADFILRMGSLTF